VDFVNNPKSKRKLLKVDVIPTENLCNLIEESRTVDMYTFINETLKVNFKYSILICLGLENKEN